MSQGRIVLMATIWMWFAFLLTHTVDGQNNELQGVLVPNKTHLVSFATGKQFLRIQRTLEEIHKKAGFASHSAWTLLDAKKSYVNEDFGQLYRVCPLHVILRATMDTLAREMHPLSEGGKMTDQVYNVIVTVWNNAGTRNQKMLDCPKFFGDTREALHLYLEKLWQNRGKGDSNVEYVNHEKFWQPEEQAVEHDDANVVATMTETKNTGSKNNKVKIPLKDYMPRDLRYLDWYWEIGPLLNIMESYFPSLLWMWKPVIILEKMKEMEMGEYVLYHDTSKYFTNSYKPSDLFRRGNNDRPIYDRYLPFMIPYWNYYVDAHGHHDGEEGGDRRHGERGYILSKQRLQKIQKHAKAVSNPKQRVEEEENFLAKLQRLAVYGNPSCNCIPGIRLPMSATWEWSSVCHSHGVSDNTTHGGLRDKLMQDGSSFLPKKDWEETMVLEGKIRAKLVQKWKKDDTKSNIDEDGEFATNFGSLCSTLVQIGICKKDDNLSGDATFNRNDPTFNADTFSCCYSFWDNEVPMVQGSMSFWQKNPTTIAFLELWRDEMIKIVPYGKLPFVDQSVLGLLILKKNLKMLSTDPIFPTFIGDDPCLWREHKGEEIEKFHEDIQKEEELEKREKESGVFDDKWSDMGVGSTDMPINELKSMFTRGKIRLSIDGNKLRPAAIINDLRHCSKLFPLTYPVKNVLAYISNYTQITMIGNNMTRGYDFNKRSMTPSLWNLTTHSIQKAKSYCR